jgi:ubiquinone/menaquinone biosynthesis C-methylase UbiE
VGTGGFVDSFQNLSTHNFYCVDVNLVELKQGRKVFNSEKLNFIYADMFSSEIAKASFDIITVNAAVQYFPDLKRLLKRLTDLICENGEVHILDSPFYFKNDAVNAKKRTMEYYSSIGFKEMAENYYHHTWDELSEFKFEIRYQPSSISNKIKRLISKADSPFQWIKITR